MEIMKAFLVGLSIGALLIASVELPKFLANVDSIANSLQTIAARQ